MVSHIGEFHRIDIEKATGRKDGDDIEKKEDKWPPAKTVAIMKKDTTDNYQA
jgi:hypothetical protein